MSGVDDYENQYMGGGAILYQTKAKAPWTFHLVMLSPILFSSLVLTLSSFAPKAPSWLPLMILPSVLFILPLWLLFSVLRVTVTATHVHIQYGLFGPKIPLEAITACEGVAYDWKKYGGFGIRRGADGSTAYNMMGDQGRAVKLTWMDERGRPATTLVSAQDPDAFVRAVNQAKQGAAKPHVRVSAEARAAAKGLSPEQMREAEAELDAEFPSGEAEQKKERR
ncbi:MAG: hypothetical protein U0414_02200 [Polyangiaceae bacterium]